MIRWRINFLVFILKKNLFHIICGSDIYAQRSKVKREVVLIIWSQGEKQNRQKAGKVRYCDWKSLKMTKLSDLYKQRVEEILWKFLTYLSSESTTPRSYLMRVVLVTVTVSAFSPQKYFNPNPKLEQVTPDVATSLLKIVLKLCQAVHYWHTDPAYISTPTHRRAYGLKRERI